MNLKISAKFDGKCDLCNKEARVFTMGDEDTYRAVTVCGDCVAKIGSKPVSEVVEEHGKENKEAFQGGVRLEKGNRPTENRHN